MSILLDVFYFQCLQNKLYDSNFTKRCLTLNITNRD